MHKLRPVVRAFAFAIAAMQLVIAAGAPVLDTLPWGSSERIQSSSGASAKAAPAHAHDANTCLVCRLLDSPPRVEVARNEAHVSSLDAALVQPVAIFVSLTAQRGFDSRAPPASLS